MYLKVEQSDSNRFVFSLVVGETSLFRSNDSPLPFLGEYGDYPTFDEALKASTLFAYRNFPTLTRFADLESTMSSDDIKSRMVAKFTRGMHIFTKLLERMKNTKEKGDIKQRVQTLKQMVDQYAKAILDTAKMFENEARVDNIPEEVPIQEISFSELESPYSIDLLSLKKQLHEFYQDFRDNFGEYLDAVASGQINRVVTAGEEPWYRDVLVEFGESISSSLSLADVKFSSVGEIDNGYELSFCTKHGGLTVSFGKDMTMTGINPGEGLIELFPPMSQDYYNVLWYPIFKTVGNFRVEENVVAIPKRSIKGRKIGYSNDGKYLKDSFVAFDLRDGSEMSVEVHLRGKECCGSKTCSFVLASGQQREVDINQTLDQDMETLRRTKMVRCINTGTKYDGLAGEVDHKGVVRRETYIEIPVVFQFDNSNVETVILTNSQVEKYA